MPGEFSQSVPFSGAISRDVSSRQRNITLTEIWATLLIFLCVGVNYAVLLDLRLNLGGTPVSLMDLVLLLALFGAIWRKLFGYRLRVRVPSILKMIAAAFAALACIGLLNGIRAGFPLYDAVKDFRVVLYFLLSFWLFTSSLSARFHWRILVPVLIWSGFAVAAQVLALFALTYRETGMVAWGRQVYVPAQILPFSAIFLLYKRAWFSTAWPRSLMYGGISILIVALLVSFTRVVWLQLVLAACFLLVMGYRQRGFAAAAVVVLLLLISVLTVFSVWAPLQGVAEEIQGRVLAFADFFRGEEQGTLYSRVDEILEGLNAFRKSPVIGLGLGSTVVHFNPAENQLEETTYLHNSVIYYMVKLGMLGLGVFALFCWFCLREAWRVPRNSQFYVLSRVLLAGLGAFILAGNFSGNLSYPPFMILLGTLLGQCVVLKNLSDRERLNPARAVRRERLDQNGIL